MLTKDQADAVANSMLEQQRARTLAQSNRRWWRYPDLFALEPEQRSEVVREAKCAVNRNWRVHLAALAWFSAYALTWLFLMPDGDKRASLAVFVLGATLPIPLFYGGMVRREVRRVAATRAPRKSIS